MFGSTLTVTGSRPPRNLGRLPFVQILASLFGGNGLAVVDLLLENPELEVRVHSLELLSALLVHKKVWEGGGWRA